jgi:predicted DNA-binding antitoxin AbrB/MazE fold protein
LSFEELKKMSEKISAIYENGVLVLEKPLSVSEGSKVEIIVIKKKIKKTPAELLAEIAALPLEGKTDKFSGRDHDKILYREK